MLRWLTLVLIALTIVAVPTAAQASRPDGYRTMGSARWDPCQDIDYRINPQRMWPGGASDVRDALKAVSQASGLKFTYRGRSSFIPYRNHGLLGSFPGNADLVIAWSTPTQVPGLGGSTVGIGGSMIGSMSTSQAERYDGGVVLDGVQRLGRTQAQTHRYRMLLLLHELGHAIGLDHVNDRHQVMYPQILNIPARYAAGDLRGLAKLGAGGGCIERSIR